MRKLTLLGGVLLTFLTLAVVTSYLTSLPHPSHASASQIGYWLVLRDMDQERPEIRAALIERLVNDSETLFEEADSKGVSQPKLSPQQQERLSKNIDLLKFEWFCGCIEQYQAVDQNEKSDFLSQQLKTVECWATLVSEHLGPQLESSNNAHSQATEPPEEGEVDLTGFFDDVEGWIARTAPDKRSLAYAAVQDALIHWLSISSLVDVQMETRIELANRLARELDAGAKAADSVDVIQESQSTLLSENTQILTQAWLVGKAQSMDALTIEQDKNAFVDSTIAQVKKWDLLSLLAATQPDAKASPSQLQQLLAFGATVEQWIAELEAPSSEQLRSLFDRIKIRLVTSMH